MFILNKFKYFVRPVISIHKQVHFRQIFVQNKIKPACRLTMTSNSYALRFIQSSSLHHLEKKILNEDALDEFIQLQDRMNIICQEIKVKLKLEDVNERKKDLQDFFTLKDKMMEILLNMEIEASMNSETIKEEQSDFQHLQEDRALKENAFDEFIRLQDKLRHIIFDTKFETTMNTETVNQEILNLLEKERWLLAVISIWNRREKKVIRIMNNAMNTCDLRLQNVLFKDRNGDYTLKMITTVSEALVWGSTIGIVFSLFYVFQLVLSK